MIDTQRMLQKVTACGLTYTTKMLEQLNQYAEILVAYNQKVNLTAITTPEEIEDKHFIDSLFFANLPEVRGKVVDVGTGAGFPGVVAKLYKPEIDLYLMEPTGKRLDFLRFLCSELRIEATFIKERAEEAARKEWREVFDVATARAVAGLSVLAEYCIPLVKPGGYFVAMKGAKDEQQDAEKAVNILGGTFIRKETYELPNKESRMLLMYRKEKETPQGYPRNGGKINKKPL